MDSGESSIGEVIKTVCSRRAMRSGQTGHSSISMPGHHLEAGKHLSQGNSYTHMAKLPIYFLGSTY